MRRKRFLWVLGVSDRNLGEMIVDLALQADDGHRYENVYHTDNMDCDVSRGGVILQKAKEFGLKNELSVMDVVYCVGVNRLSSIHEMEEMDIWDTFNANVMGFVRLMSALTHTRGEGNVVAVASDAARNPMRNSINYCASKAALVMAMRVAARELAPKWRVNAVSPAIIEGTPMSEDIDLAVQAQRGWTHEEAMAYERSMIPMGRRAYKSEVARVVLETLVGPEFLTGSNLEITGGK